MAFLLSAGEELLPLSRCCIGSIGGIGVEGAGGTDDPCNITDSLVVSPCSSSSSSEEDDEEEDNDTKVAAPLSHDTDLNSRLAAPPPRPPPPSTTKTSSQSPWAPTTTKSITGGLKKKEVVHDAASLASATAATVPRDVILKQKSDVGNDDHDVVGGAAVTVPATGAAVKKQQKGRQDLFEAGFEKFFGLTAICTATTATATATTAQQRERQPRRGGAQVTKSQNKEKEEGKNGKASRMRMVPTEKRCHTEEEDTTVAASLSEGSRSISSTTATAAEPERIRERSVTSPISKQPLPPVVPSKEDCEDRDSKKTKLREQMKNDCLAAAPETPLPPTKPRGVNQKTSDSQQPQQAVLPATTATKAIMDAVCFEMKFVGLASWTLVLYCMAHYAIYELLYTIILETTEANGIYQIYQLNLVYGGLLMLGLTLLRGTGYLWNFLKSKHYRQTKAVLKERRLRGKKSGVGSTSWDVRIHDWFEDRDVLRMTVEVIAFYLCYISLMFFWSKFLTNCVDQREVIFQQLPSVQYRLLQQEQEGKDELGISSSGSSSADCSGVEASSKNSWDVEDFDYIYKTVAKTTYYQYSGSADAPLYSAPLGIMVYACTLSLSIFFLSKTGVSFGDTWE